MLHNVSSLLIAKMGYDEQMIVLKLSSKFLVSKGLKYKIMTKNMLYIYHRHFSLELFIFKQEKKYWKNKTFHQLFLRKEQNILFWLDTLKLCFSVFNVKHTQIELTNLFPDCKSRSLNYSWTWVQYSIKSIEINVTPLRRVTYQCVIEYLTLLITSCPRSTEETFLQYFVVILKRPLQNCSYQSLNIEEIFPRYLY